MSAPSSIYGANRIGLTAPQRNYLRYVIAICIATMLLSLICGLYVLDGLFNSADQGTFWLLFGCVLLGFGTSGYVGWRYWSDLMDGFAVIRRQRLLNVGRGRFTVIKLSDMGSMFCAMQPFFVGRPEDFIEREIEVVYSPRSRTAWEIRLPSDRHSD